MGPRKAVLEPGCQLPTGSFCPLCKHPVCWSLCFLSSEPLNVPFCLPAGSKTREGVVQGVASGTSPTVSQTLFLPQPESWLGSRGWQGGVVEEDIPKAYGVLHGEGWPWDTAGSEGYLCLLHPGP